MQDLHTLTPTAGSDAGDPSEVLLALESHHLDAEEIERALAALLARYPEAPVGIMRSDGICVEVPDGLDLGGHTVLVGRSGLDLVAHEDRLRMLATWDDVLSRGAARCRTHLLEAAAKPVTFYGFDLRERYGVLVTVYVATGGAEEPAEEPADAPSAPPRFATVTKDERSFIIDIDAAITQLLGWTAEEMVGRRSIEFIHPDDHPLAIDNWMQMLAAPGPGRRVRLRHRHRDGTWVWFEVTNHNLLDDGQRHAVISEMVDISEEMAANEELRARKELLDRIAEAMPVGLLQVDAGRNVVYTNDRLHEILDAGRASSAEAQLATLLDDDREQLLHALGTVLEGGQSADLEVLLHRPGEQEQRRCAVSVRPLSDSEGATAGAIACVTDITDGARLREELRRRATFDELTGCYNRAAITALLERVVPGEGDDGCAVLFVDLDRFKEVNDRLGHAAGDELLRVLAARLRSAVRERDHVGRVGGDEFLVVCPQVGSREVVDALAGRVKQLLREPVQLGPDTVALGVSVGVAWALCGTASAESLIAQADNAMYGEKRLAQVATG